MTRFLLTLLYRAKLLLDRNWFLGFKVSGTAFGFGGGLATGWRPKNDRTLENSLASLEVFLYLKFLHLL